MIENELKLIKNIMQDLSGKYAYYICGTTEYDNTEIIFWLKRTFEYLDEKITFADWLNKFVEGSFTDAHIRQWNRYDTI